MKQLILLILYTEVNHKQLLITMERDTGNYKQINKKQALRKDSESNNILSGFKT